MLYEVITMVERLLIGLLGQGHILLEGVPGLAVITSYSIHYTKLYDIDFSYGFD